jgi:hypothetical protein
LSRSQARSTGRFCEISAATELANPKSAVGLGEVRLRPGSSKRCTWRNQNSQPLAQRIEVVDSPTTELKGNRLKLPQRRERGRRHLLVAQEHVSAGKAKTQRALAREVLHSNQEVPGVQRARGALLVFGLQRFAAFHQRLTPPVW